MSVSPPSPALREASSWLYDAIAAAPSYNPLHEHLRSALGQGKARSGVGRACGENRALDAARTALEDFGNGLSDYGFLLMDIGASENLSMAEYAEAVRFMEAEVKRQGFVWDMHTRVTLSDSFGEEVRVILLATENKME